MTNRVHNLYISSANRNSNDKTYDFKLYFNNNEIVLNPNEGVNISVVGFSLLNSMYNVNQNSSNNVFLLKNTTTNMTNTITIPYGNYSVYTLSQQLNTLINTYSIKVDYNIATNTYTYTNTSSSYTYEITPLNCYKLLGLTSTTTIGPLGNITGTYVNMVNYQQIILRCPSLVFENNSLDNLQDKNNEIAFSDVLFWYNKQDVEPFKMINYKNEDGGTLYSYNVINRNFSVLNFKLVNEFNQPIYDAPDYLLQLQMSIYEKDDNYFKNGVIQILKLLNEIYFTLLNIVSLMVSQKK